MHILYLLHAWPDVIPNGIKIISVNNQVAQILLGCY